MEQPCLPWKDFLPFTEAQHEGCCTFSVFRSLWRTERKAQVHLVVLCWDFDFHVTLFRDGAIPQKTWLFTSKFRCDSGKSTLALLEQVRECPTGMGTEVPLLTELHLLRWLDIPLDGQFKPGNPREEDRWVLFTVLLQVRPMHCARVLLDHDVISIKTGGEQ